MITCDNILYTKYSNVHHPPIVADEQEDCHRYSQVQSEQLRPHKPIREKQLSVHERNSSASALLTPHLSVNDYEIDEMSLARTEESRSYRDEDNLGVEGFGGSDSLVLANAA